MKYAWIVLLFVVLWWMAAASQAAPGYLVFGDSQSLTVIDTADASKNWPNVLQNFQNTQGESLGLHFFNLSRGGRGLSSGNVADYLRLVDVTPANNEVRGIIIAMGSWDAYFQQDIVPALTDALQEAAQRDLSVYCVLPPDNQLFDVSAVRETLSAHCSLTIPVHTALGPDDMPEDGLHIGEAGHAVYASTVFWALLLSGGIN